MRTAPDVVAFQLAVEGGAADPQHLARQHLVSFYLFEDALDGVAFDVLEVGGHGQVDGGGPRDAVLQFAHVAGPVVLEQRLHGGAGHLHRASGGAALQEPVRQHGDVGAALAQGGHVQGHDVEPEIEVLAEGAGAVFLLQVAVGGGDDAYVDLDALVAADGADLFFLQDAQQLGLHLERQLPDLVEEQGPAIGRLKQPGARAEGAGEGALLVAEQFAFDQGGNEGAAVDGDEGAAGERSAEVDGAGDQFLAGAAFAGNEHRGASVFEARNHAQHVLDLGGGADDAVELGLGVHAVAQELVFLDQADLFGHATQEQAQFLQRREGFGDVVIGAELHGLHGGLDRAVAGHDRDLGAREHLLDLLQELQARHLRHDQVGQDHVGRLFLEPGQSGLAAGGFQAYKAQGLPHGDAQAADALLVVNNQQADAKVFAHSVFFNDTATTEMNCCTRKGFSTQGAPVRRRVSTVCSLAMSPVMNTRRAASCGRWAAIQAWTSAPLTPPGVTMSETMPR